jgi:acetoin utilization deacetylase AcuC-like enzyme
MGFCLFNNVAIAATHALRTHRLERILIVDWDLHHGNGTQNSFYDNPQVLFFSTHQFPYYPGSGTVEQSGKGDGVGYTVNVPLPGGQGNGDYLEVYREILKPISVQFNPQLVLVSAGFDTYYQDPLGAMKVTPEGFGLLALFLLELARGCSDGKIVLTLEGGYHLEGLTESIKSTLGVLTDTSSLAGEPLDSQTPLTKEITDKTIEKTKEVQRNYWSEL